jgi:hypothetical protein
MGPETRLGPPFFLLFVSHEATTTNGARDLSRAPGYFSTAATSPPHPYDNESATTTTKGRKKGPETRLGPMVFFGCHVITLRRRMGLEHVSSTSCSFFFSSVATSSRRTTTNGPETCLGPLQYVFFSFLIFFTNYYLIPRHFDATKRR